MSEQVANAFIQALWTLEETKDAEPLAALYTEDALVGNLIAPDQFQGSDGARTFWTEYRGSFETAHSKFRNVIAGDGSAALEWSYSGVTILETEDGKVTRSSAYFNPADLGRQMGVK